MRDALGTWIRLIDANPFTIGRRETNHLQLASAEVSREHADLVMDDGRYLLRDRHSRYGTFVGGESITERQLLASETTQCTLEALAAEASIAIEHARLYRETLEKAKLEHELHVAAEIQRALLPRSLVTLPYVEAAAVSKPCRAVGGDFFDYLRTSAAVFGFTVGDVAGKGPPAALMSAMMQGMFAYAARGQDPGDPASIVANINQALCQREVELRFVTLFFGVLEPDGRLCYCNAGHNPPFVVGERGVRAGAVQSDDTTVMALRYRGAPDQQQ